MNTLLTAARSFAVTMVLAWAVIFLIFLTAVVKTVWWQLFTISLVVFVALLPLTVTGWFVAFVARGYLKGRKA